MSARVAVAGVVNVRAARRFAVFPPTPTQRYDPHGISIRLSGTGWTVARTLQQLGSEVLFATYVGRDELGQFVAGGLAECGLLGPTTLRCESTPRAMVLYGPDGAKVAATDLRTTPELSYPADVFATALAGRPYDMAMLTNIGFTRSLIPVAQHNDVPIATDLHVVDDPDSAYNRPWMAAAHVLACSHEELPVSPENWVRAMWSRYGTEIVLIGSGAAGAMLGVRSIRRIWRVPAVLPRGLKYTSGAGDTLLASFVHHYLTLADPLLAVRLAVLAAGWKVGADPDEETGTSASLSTLCPLPGPPRSIALDE